MGISSTGSGRPSPLGPVPVQPRTTCQGQPGAACPLGGRLRSCPWGAAPRCPPGPGRGRGAVLRTLRVVQALTRPRGAAPRCPACPAGVPISPEKWGEKRAGGGAPWTPSFMARLLPLAHFGGRAALSRSWGYFAAHLRTLIWGLSFIKCFFSIFFTRKCVPNRS